MFVSKILQNLIWMLNSLRCVLFVLLIQFTFSLLGMCGGRPRRKYSRLFELYEWFTFFQDGVKEFYSYAVWFDTFFSPIRIGCTHSPSPFACEKRIGSYNRKIGFPTFYFSSHRLKNEFPRDYISRSPNLRRLNCRNHSKHCEWSCSH